MNKQKYRNFLITSILTAIVIIVVSTVIYTPFLIAYEKYQANQAAEA